MSHKIKNSIEPSHWACSLDSVLHFIEYRSHEVLKGVWQSVESSPSYANAFRNSEGFFYSVICPNFVLIYPPAFTDLLTQSITAISVQIRNASEIHHRNKEECSEHVTNTFLETDYAERLHNFANRCSGLMVWYADVIDGWPAFSNAAISFHSWWNRM